jgi:glycosyltransferase involved in cell wall biosynthesis
MRLNRSRWYVVRLGELRRWGGEIRRQEIFSALAERTDGVVADGWPALRESLSGGRIGRPLLRIRRRLHLGRPSPLGRRVAASEQVGGWWLKWVTENVDPVVVAIYDDPVLQARAVGVTMDPERAAELTLRRSQNERTFRWHVVPTASFADLIGLDRDRVIVGGNGTVTARVRPGPWPSTPTIGIASGAAPGRGLEALVEAARLLRSSLPDLQLRLWLTATAGGGDQYVDTLAEKVRRDPWITIGNAPYEQLGETLAEAAVLCIPTPATDYSDVALPVKLFDSMAAGRPLVVTPRTETAAVVEQHGVGVVAAGDDPAALADAFAQLLGDEGRARRIGAHAREVAEREFDWPIVSGRIADEILRREAR